MLNILAQCSYFGKMAAWHCCAAMEERHGRRFIFTTEAVMRLNKGQKWKHQQHNQT